MGADRRQQHNFEGGKNYWSARAERVSGGSGWRGDDQAVCPVGAKVLAVSDNVQFHQAPQMALMDDDVVERLDHGGMLGGAVGAGYIRLQRDAPVNGVVALQHSLNGGTRLFHRGLGQESERAQVDAQDRGLTLADKARDAQ